MPDCEAVVPLFKEYQKRAKACANVIKETSQRDMVVVSEFCCKNAPLGIQSEAGVHLSSWVGRYNCTTQPTKFLLCFFKANGSLKTAFSQISISSAPCACSRRRVEVACLTIGAPRDDDLSDARPT